MVKMCNICSDNLASSRFGLFDLIISQRPAPPTLVVWQVRERRKAECRTKGDRLFRRDAPRGRRRREGGAAAGERGAGGIFLFLSEDDAARIETTQQRRQSPLVEAPFQRQSFRLEGAFEPDREHRRGRQHRRQVSDAFCSSTRDTRLNRDPLRQRERIFRSRVGNHSAARGGRRGADVCGRPRALRARALRRLDERVHQHRRGVARHDPAVSFRHRNGTARGGGLRPATQHGQGGKKEARAFTRIQEKGCETTCPTTMLLWLLVPEAADRAAFD